MLQMKLGLGLLLNRFRFNVCEKTDNPIKIDNVNLFHGPAGNVFLNIEAMWRNLIFRVWFIFVSFGGLQTLGKSYNKIFVKKAFLKKFFFEIQLFSVIEITEFKSVEYEISAFQMYSMMIHITRIKYLQTFRPLNNRLQKKIILHICLPWTFWL